MYKGIVRPRSQNLDVYPVQSQRAHAFVFSERLIMQQIKWIEETEIETA